MSSSLKMEHVFGWSNFPCFLWIFFLILYGLLFAIIFFSAFLTWYILSRVRVSKVGPLYKSKQTCQDSNFATFCNTERLFRPQRHGEVNKNTRCKLQVRSSVTLGSLLYSTVSDDFQYKSWISILQQTEEFYSTPRLTDCDMQTYLVVGCILKYKGTKNDLVSYRKKSTACCFHHRK